METVEQVIDEIIDWIDVDRNGLVIDADSEWND